MSTIDQLEEDAQTKTPKVFDALLEIKFRLITVPIICVAIGLAVQAVTTERNVGVIMFEMGTFATPGQPNPVPLAGAEQVKARLRQNSWEIRDDFPRSVIMPTLIENDVVTVTGTAKGPELTKQYLTTLVNMEIDFQNNRLEKMKKAQLDRMELLRRNLEKFKSQREDKEAQLVKTDDPIAMLAIQQGIDQASVLIGGIQKELDAHATLNSSDLFVDYSKVILEPIIVASSGWYRPLLAGAIGLGIGLLITFMIAIIAVMGKFASGQKKGL